MTVKIDEKGRGKDVKCARKGGDFGDFAIFSGSQKTTVRF